MKLPDEKAQYLQITQSHNQQDYFMHTILNTVDSLVVVLDPHCHIVLFNTACERLTGYTFAEVKGKNVDSFLLPEEAQCIVNCIKARTTGKQTFYWRGRDGGKHLIEWTYAHLTDAQGQPQFYVGTGNDITEAIKAKKALQASETRFRELFHNANDAIFVASVKDGIFSNYLEVNDTACEKLGYTRAELLQMSPVTIPRKQETSRKQKQGNLSVSASFEVMLMTKDGRAIPFEHNAHLFEIDGQTFCIAVARDVSDRKQIEDTLRQSEECYRRLVELSPDAIFVHSERKIVFANSACAKLLRAVSEHWLIGRKIDEIIHPDYLDAINQRIELLTHGQMPQPYLEQIIRCYDGTEQEFEATSSYLFYNGQPSIQVIYRDITRKNRLQQEALRASKLHSIGSLAGNIAHEFNNQLTVILGNLSIAQLYATKQPKLQKVLENADKASGQARALTQQLLTYARGGQPVKQVTNLRSLLFKCTDHLLHNERFTCDFKIPGDLLMVAVDEDQVYHAISNILANAQQAMPEGGTIYIAAENVTTEEMPLPPELNVPYVKVSITDEGPGIPAQNMDHIFDPFYSTKPDGNGLGLPTSYSIINKHGGYLLAESIVGEGATFTIYLPTVAHTPAVTKHEDEKTAASLEHVLLMDDDEDVLAVTQEMLTLLGHTVITAKHGAEALQLYQEADRMGMPFSLVILDLFVKDGMGGKETLHQLLVLNPQVRAIVTSGYFSDPIMANFQQYGFCGCIPKPFTMEELNQVLEARA
ncbi:MAG: PAS domain S-box protein [Firmicutes bacterium]|nr:PAS domain S-box protein [Bacillota bacterium]